MFYPASTLYALAEETYRLGLYGLCNTENLRQHLRATTTAARACRFTPAVDPTRLPRPAAGTERTPGSPVTVFVYARPGPLAELLGAGLARAGGAQAPARRPGADRHRRLVGDRRGRRRRTSSTSACSTTGRPASCTATATSAWRSRCPSTRRTCRWSSWPAACRWWPSTTRGATGCCATSENSPAGPADRRRPGRPARAAVRRPGAARAAVRRRRCADIALGHGDWDTALGADLRLPLRPRRAARLTSGRGAGVLLVTPEPLVERMAGPAIRCLELARALARSGRVGPVTVASLTAAELDEPTSRCSRADGAGRCAPLAAERRLASSSRATCSACTRGWPTPTSRSSSTPTTRSTSSSSSRPAALGEARRRAVVRDCVRALDRQLARADFVLCASARQRALWIGHLARARPGQPGHLRRRPRPVRRWSPSSRSACRRRRRGRATGRGCTAALPGIGPDDDGASSGAAGIYDWFDPETVIRAVGRLAADRPRPAAAVPRHPASRAGRRRRRRGRAGAALGRGARAARRRSCTSTTTGCPTPSGTSGWRRPTSGVSTHHRAPGDRVLLPHPDRRLPVVRPAGGDHRRRRARRPGRRPRAPASPVAAGRRRRLRRGARRAARRPGRRASRRRGAPATWPASLSLGRRRRAAGRLLRRAAPRTRPASSARPTGSCWGCGPARRAGPWAPGSAPRCARAAPGLLARRLVRRLSRLPSSSGR